MSVGVLATVLTGSRAEQGDLDLDAPGVLDLITATQRVEWEAGRGKLRLAAAWCVLHPATDDSGAAVWGDAGLPGTSEWEELLGGQGCPGVAAFTPEPFAAALGVSTWAGRSLLADALDLVQRLPGLWGCVQRLEVAPWLARRVAETTRPLNLAAVGFVDRHLAARIRDGAAHGQVTLDRLIAQAVASYQPDLVTDREQAAKDTWDVTLTHGLPVPGAAGDWAATSDLHARGDTLDLTAFHHLVCAEAHRFHRLGDPDPLGARKAKALGVIAGTQPVLDYPDTGAPGDPAVSTSSTSGKVSTGGPDTVVSTGSTGVRGTTPRTMLYLHASLSDLLGLDGAVRGSGCGWVERLGPVTLERIRGWVARTEVTIRPVLDLNRVDAVDAHDPPDWMRELVVLRDGHCVFPTCGRDARACDLDHIDPYLPPDHGGPPGQTSPANLAPSCRRHHRAKTARAWSYTRDREGTYTWTSPYRRRYLVTPRGGGTQRLDP